MDLQEIEERTGRKVSTILQLRLHPAIKALKEKVAADQKNEFSIDLTYITSRGRWYHTSWKGDDAKSGGVATNIGIHFFDMLSYIFGPPSVNVAHLRDASRAAGYLMCGRASIRWFLSVDRNDLPPAIAKDKTTYRSITIDDEQLEFSEGFTDLHTRSYEEIIAGRGFTLADVRPSVDIVSEFRKAAIEAQSRRASSARCATYFMNSVTPMDVRFPNVRIHESSYVDEPVQIGEGTSIWHFCHILGEVSIGRHCSIGQNVVIGPRVTHR